MTTAKMLAGASGYSFEEWKGVFYPEDIKAEEMLAFYSAPLSGCASKRTPTHEMGAQTPDHALARDRCLLHL